jgi:hypothetical protein
MELSGQSHALPALPIKVHPRTDHERPEGEQMYSSTHTPTSVLDGVGGQRHAPAALPPGKTRYPLHRRLGGRQGRCGGVRKMSSSPGFECFTSYPLKMRLRWHQSHSKNFGEKKSVSQLSEFKYSGSPHKK